MVSEKRSAASQMAMMVGLAHPLQSAPDLRLEQHHQRQQADLQQRVEQPGHRAHIQDIGHQINHQHQQRALGQLTRAGTVDDAQQLVDKECDHQDIQQIHQLKGLEIGYDRVQSHRRNTPVLFLLSYSFSMRATAWAAMPSPSPVKPKCSSVVALTLTASTGIPKASASFWRMAGM